MKRACFVCLATAFTFAALLSLVAAQSNSAADAGQLSALREVSRGTPESQKLPVKFAQAVTYNSGGYEAGSVAVGDLNGDGKLDLVVSNVCQTESDCSNGGLVSVLLGNGDGTFQSAVSYPSGGYLAGMVAIADVNGDGHPDLIAVNFCQSVCSGVAPGGVSVLLGNGDGTFQQPVEYSSGGYAASFVLIGDVNGDAKPDLVVINVCQMGNCDSGDIAVLLGNGDGTFQAPVGYSMLVGAEAAIGDLNGDGKLDLVVTSDDGVSVLLGNGDGTFEAPVNYGSGGYGTLSVAIGDLNGDGKLDLVVGNRCPANCNGEHHKGTVGVLLGNGDGTFQPAISRISGEGGALSVAIGDVNGDGHPDVVTSAFSGGKDFKYSDAAVLLGNGDGTLQEPVNYDSGGGAVVWVAIGDVNGDGRPDLLASNLCEFCTNGNVGVLLNTLTVNTATAVTSSANPSQVNQSVTFTATITSRSYVPNSSTVTFYNGATSLGTGTTTNGVASLTTSFSTAGSYTIKASYPGDAFHKASAGTVKQVVQQAGK